MPLGRGIVVTHVTLRTVVIQFDNQSTMKQAYCCFRENCESVAFHFFTREPIIFVQLRDLRKCTEFPTLSLSTTASSQTTEAHRQSSLFTCLRANACAVSYIRPSINIAHRCHLWQLSWLLVETSV
jgi:hypothetical protein